MVKKNLFDLPELLPDHEIFEQLSHDRGVLIERIISSGQATPRGHWYDQERDELVVLLQGEASISFEEGETMDMIAGDYILIPAHKRHRVEYTSKDPPCVWLAVHADLPPARDESGHYGD
jgi:cupin 2 domain-containing protein